MVSHDPIWVVTDGQTGRKSLRPEDLSGALGNMLSDGFPLYPLTAENDEDFVEFRLFIQC